MHKPVAVLDAKIRRCPDGDFGSSEHAVWLVEQGRMACRRTMQEAGDAHFGLSLRALSQLAAQADFRTPA